MKAAAILLITLGLFFMHAEALRCRQSSCVGSGPCSSTTVTCRNDFNLCFSIIKSSPLFMVTRGCTNEANCQIMKAYEPSTRCCNKELCN